jgi:hypothetical protein
MRPLIAAISASLPKTPTFPILATMTLPPTDTMKDIEPTVLRLWQDAKLDFCAALGTPQGLAFLGVILAYPFHRWLLSERVGIVPGAWLHGPMMTGKSRTAQAAACFYWPPDLHPVVTPESAHLQLPRTLARHPGLPVTFEASSYSPLAVETIATLRLSSHGIMDRGITGCTIGSKGDCSPPLIVSDETTTDSPTASRYLHFSPIPDSSRPYQDIIRHRECFPAITAACFDNSVFLRLLIDGILQESGNYIHGPTLNGRQACLLTTAWAIFCAVDALIGGGESDSILLKAWLCEHGIALWSRDLAIA